MFEPQSLHILYNVHNNRASSRGLR